MVRIRVLALDLEGTIITDAYHQEPRPGLHEFAVFCLERFERVVIFTCVACSAARSIIDHLEEEGEIPREFLQRCEYVEWQGDFKDLNFVEGAEPAEILIVDDDGSFILPSQEYQWVGVTSYLGDEDDTELERVAEELARRLGP
jgi:hypothetical protein